MHQVVAPLYLSLLLPIIIPTLMSFPFPFSSLQVVAGVGAEVVLVVVVVGVDVASVAGVALPEAAAVEPLVDEVEAEEEDEEEDEGRVG